MADREPMTVEGYQRLKDEVKQLKTVERPKTSQEIETARAHGDLSENAEYHAAREKLSFIEGRIAEIESKLALSEVIDPKTLAVEHVVFGATVTLSDAESGDEVTYKIVGVDEADLKEGKISYSSPVARALIRKGVGDIAVVRTKRGEREYEIVKVDFV